MWRAGPAGTPPVALPPNLHWHLASAHAAVAVLAALAVRDHVGGQFVDISAQDRHLWEGEGRSFGPRHIHNVANLGDRPALSVHVYSPALRGMTRYALLDNRLRETSVERAGERW